MCTQKGIFNVLDEKCIIACGDCLEVMKEIPDKSVDLVLTDPPYGTTACKWDTAIDFQLMWEQLKRIIKPNGAICLFGSEPFSSLLRCSNIKNFKYDWVWNKGVGSNFASLKYQPMREHELISIFSIKTHLYYPIKQIRNGTGASRMKYPVTSQGTVEVYGINRGVQQNKFYNKDLRNPSSIQFFTSRENCRGLHPTQKPVALLEYLIKTYTLENETVLDFTMGSGSTGVACKNLNRKFIGIEKEEKYFEICKERINGG